MNTVINVKITSMLIFGFNRRIKQNQHLSHSITRLHNGRRSNTYMHIEYANISDVTPKLCLTSLLSTSKNIICQRVAYPLIGTVFYLHEKKTKENRFAGFLRFQYINFNFVSCKDRYYSLIHLAILHIIVYQNKKVILANNHG